ncbi:MAG: PIN domain-containing protein [bacterium]
MKLYIVDTHVIIWYLIGDKRLSVRAERILDSDNIILVFPTIVLAEIKYLFSKKRIKLSLETVIEYIRGDPRCLIYPLDIACIEEMDTQLNIHDAAIVSVAKVYEKFMKADAIIISKDEDIRNLSGIKVIW